METLVSESRCALISELEELRISHRLRSVLRAILLSTELWFRARCRVSSVVDESLLSLRSNHAGSSAARFAAH